jgi:glycosyltransferase involved in cell wall biosynthesis
VRTAIVCDWLVVYAGAERVIEQMLAVYPEAELLALFEFLPADQRAFLGGRPVRTTFLQHMPRARTSYRQYLPLMPAAIATLDVSQYDVVISSSHAVAKGVRTRPDQLHLCMCYSPMRYAWDLRDQYLRETRLDHGLKGWLANGLLDRMQAWDLRTARRVDGFIAISHHIARRIRAAYGRDSTVIYPPVDVDYYTPGESREGFYLTASRLVPYKRVDLIVGAFASMPDRTLVVIGDGPEMAKVRAKAGPNVRLLGHQPGSVLREHLRRARAFVFAAEEDFGIAPLEAQACGTPVVGYAAGALPETVNGLDTTEPTGVFFADQTADAIVRAVGIFEAESSRLSSEACRRNALRFSPKRFCQEFRDHVERLISLKLDWTPGQP